MKKEEGNEEAGGSAGKPKAVAKKAAPKPKKLTEVG